MGISRGFPPVGKPVPSPTRPGRLPSRPLAPNPPELGVPPCFVVSVNVLGQPSLD